MLWYLVLVLICFVRGTEVFDVQEVWPLVRPEARTSPLGNTNWIEFGISLSTSLASCGLLAEATYLGSQCAHLDDCSNLDPVIDFMKYAVAAWIGGKMVQCVMGCVSVGAPHYSTYFDDDFYPVFVGSIDDNSYTGTSTDCSWVLVLVAGIGGT